MRLPWWRLMGNMSILPATTVARLKELCKTLKPSYNETIIIPIDATEDDLLLLHDMFDVLLKRKFKIDI